MEISELQTKIIGIVKQRSKPLYYGTYKGSHEIIIVTPKHNYPIVVPREVYDIERTIKGDEMEFDVDIETNEYNEKYYVNLVAFNAKMIAQKERKLDEDVYSRSVQHLQPNHEFVNNNDSEPPF